MIEVKLVTDKKQQLEVYNQINVGNFSNILAMWGMWKNSKCLGGVYITNDFLTEYIIGFTCRPSMELGIALYKITTEALKLKQPLYSSVAITNFKSRKGARQLGFVPIRVEDDQEKLQLNKISEKMQNRWNNYVESNS